MTPEERDLITGLFQRLTTADTHEKDDEAAQLIQRSISAQPSAAYLLVQTVLVQEHALQNAQARIAQLEKQVAAAGSIQKTGQPQGSFLSGFLHKLDPSAPGPRAQVPPLPYPTTMNMAPSAGGGFLRTALAAAAGVAGGSLLFQGIENLLGHNAGAFGSSLGGLGGAGRPEIIENEVTNNYYGDGGERHGGEEDLTHSVADQSGTADDQSSLLQDLGYDDSASPDTSGDASFADNDAGGGDDGSVV